MQGNFSNLKRPRLDMANPSEIDDSLYSRQRYVLGDSAMQRMARSNVLLFNIGGLGVEIAKNIVLAGVKSLTIQDGNPATLQDLGSQFFLREEDVTKQRNRAEASASRVAELNPYVSVKTLTQPLSAKSDLQYLSQFQCVVLTEASLELQKAVNDFCRQQKPPIQFITADVYGVFCWTFCDFGDRFEVLDPTGEEPKEVFISHITKSDPGEVTTLQDTLHGLETGDVVTFREICGMTALNDTTHQITVKSPTTFTICDTSGEQYGEFTHDGIATQVKVPRTVTFESLEQQLRNPELTIADFSKFTVPANLHVGMLALHQFRDTHNRLPKPWCEEDSKELIKLATVQSKTLTDPPGELDCTLLRNLSFTASGMFAPLCASLGGIVAQEVLKALTGKFTPLKQWLYIDVMEVLPSIENNGPSLFQNRQNRYDALRVCIGEEMCTKLAQLKLFMVGCGAIGCEMMKNYALLGIGTGTQGLITITDNDLIEKSNLNRQFLFRPHHIRKPKSTTAAESAKNINGELNIDAHQHKVCPQTEATVYNDDFFEQQNIVVNALDNVEARRYMDSRCVTNQRPLFESGTMGAKGHVQVIVPHLTESYTSQRDPPELEVPYCTLKSFPAQIEHCIQWARDKFESSFTQKIQLHNKFWSTTNTQELIQRLSDGQSVDGAVTASKVLANRPPTWAACVATARLKFEKYFNHRANNLLHMFPLDTKMQDGSLFWQSPKRPPKQVLFDINNPIHELFIAACARLYADVSAVSWTQEDLAKPKLTSILSNVIVPAFKPSSKKIETDENAKKTDEDSALTGDELKDAANRIQRASHKTQDAFKAMVPADFEKDDDSNGHIDFITAAANLRAMMYNIETADRLKIKRIAGRIVPAIATTTAAVAGLVTVELVKVLKAVSLGKYKNCFLNLALPVFLFSEPGSVEQLVMKNGKSYTLWDKWEVTGNKDFTVQQFLAAIKEKYGVSAESVIHGVKMLYVPIIPGHKKRLSQPMFKLLKLPASRKYVDLVVGFKTSHEPGAEEEEGGPPVRYHLGL